MKKIILSCLSLMLSFNTFAQENNLSAVRMGNHIDINVGGKYFTSYIFADDGKYPFFFPVNGPVSGTSVTAMRSNPWPHHSSLFFGCDRVNGGNYWQEGLERGRIISLGPRIAEEKGSRIVIKDECIWKRPDAEPPVIDRRTITVTAPSKTLYQIDFDVEMEMLIDVTIEQTNHSLFSVRVAPDLATQNGGTMVNSEGKEGEKATFGQPAPWMDCSGKRAGGAVEGLAIMQHPSNRWYPSPWFTRDYGFMSPTPMYWPANGKATVMKKGETVRLRYRVLVHGGNAKDADIAKLFKQYADTK